MRKLFWAIGILAVLIIIVCFYYYNAYMPAERVGFGLTFSTSYAQYLGFDPKQMYLDILSDLKPKKLRLIAYWEDMEAERGEFDFRKMDELLIEADKQNLDVILAIGHKIPRWPECHHPDWYADLTLDEQHEALLNMLKNSVEHFKQFSSVKAWQIENEPYFIFGLDCPYIPEDLIEKEVMIVKQIDQRPIILTDSGERGSWIKTSRFADQVGITMYRAVYSAWFGYYKYPLPPLFYKIKAGHFQKQIKKPLVGIELQAEPWFIQAIDKTDLETQRALMNPKVFTANVDYARKVGIGDNYIWGVEWWYWLAKSKNDWGMWATAKDLLKH